MKPDFPKRKANYIPLSKEEGLSLQNDLLRNYLQTGEVGSAMLALGTTRSKRVKSTRVSPANKHKVHSPGLVNISKMPANNYLSSLHTFSFVSLSLSSPDYFQRHLERLCVSRLNPWAFAEVIVLFSSSISSVLDGGSSPVVLNMLLNSLYVVLQLPY